MRLRVEGYVVANVEHWNPFARRRQDLWGFIDTLAFNDTELLAIQSTSASNHAARMLKVIEGMRRMPALGNLMRIEVWSWGERVARNKDGRKAKRKRWTLRRERIGGQRGLDPLPQAIRSVSGLSMDAD
jgi:hypothetical protein